MRVYKNLPYDPAKDFAPIALVAAVPFVLIVHPALQVDKVEDLVRLASEIRRWAAVVEAAGATAE